MLMLGSMQTAQPEASPPLAHALPNMVASNRPRGKIMWRVLSSSITSPIRSNLFLNVHGIPLTIMRSNTVPLMTA